MADNSLITQHSIKSVGNTEQDLVILASVQIIKLQVVGFEPRNSGCKKDITVQ